jgi:hypothetical protein
MNEASGFRDPRDRYSLGLDFQRCGEALQQAVAELDQTASEDAIKERAQSSSISASVSFTPVPVLRPT